MKRSSMIPVEVLTVALLVAACAFAGNVAHAQQPESFYPLSDFGPIDSPADARATFEKAVDQLRAGDGGVLIVPASAWRVLEPVSLQGLVREPSSNNRTPNNRSNGTMATRRADRLARQR